VIPNCAQTGTPARATASTASGKSAAPSSFTTSTPVSLASLIAALTALIGQLVAPSPASGAVLACGSTVTASVTLEADIGPCAGTGLIVTASGITLNLAGHTIRGDGNPAATPDQVGIRLVLVNNVTVTNGTVRDFNSGILVSQGGSNTISDMTVTNNVGTATSAHADGVFLFASNDNKLLRNRVTSNGPNSGINLADGSSRNLVSASLIADNNLITPPGPDSDAAQLDTGVNFTGNAMDNTIEGNQILRNGFEGVGAGGDGVGGRRVLNNVVRDNGVNGINTGGHGGDLVDGNIVDHNGYDQFRVPGVPSDFGFSGGIVMCGSCLGPGPPSTFTRNTITNNRGVGVGLLFNYFQCCGTPARDYVRSNLVQYNTIFANGGDGVYIECDQTFEPFPFVPGVSALKCIHAPTHPGQRILNNSVHRNGGAGAGVGAWDLHDGNSDCDSNTWSGNAADTFMPACTGRTEPVAPVSSRAQRSWPRRAASANAAEASPRAPPRRCSAPLANPAATRPSPLAGSSARRRSRTSTGTTPTSASAMAHATSAAGRAPSRSGVRRRRAALSSAFSQSA